MTALNTSVSSLARLGITGNKKFIQECRRMGLKYGVKLTESGGAQMNFQRGGAGTLGHGDTVPAMGFTQILEGVTVAAPKDGFRAVTAANHIWVVLNGEDVIKFTRKGITTVSAQQSPFQIDNYDDTDTQLATTEIRLVNYHNTPSSQVSFWTSRGVFGGATALQAGDQIGVIRWRGYKDGTDPISAELEVLADTGYGTYPDGRMRIRLLDNAGSFNTILDMNGSGITTVGTINGAITLRQQFTQIGYPHYQIHYASLPSFYFRRANGTEASPSNLSDNDYVGDIIHSGRIGGSFIDLSHIRCRVIESDTGESKIQLRVCGSGGSVADSVEVYPEGASVASTLAYHIGSPTVNDSWRIRIESNDLVFERRESSAWVEKSRIET